MAKTKYKILTQSEMNSIYNEINNIFTEDTANHLSINLVSLKNELEKIINKIELISVYSKNSGKLKGQRIKRSSKEKRALMAEAYLIIFKIRQFLLNETINYRYYYNTENSAKVISFSEDQLLKYIKFDTFGIKMLDSVLKKQEENTTYQNLLNIHFQNLMNGMQDSSTKGFLVVHSYIMEQYGGNGNLNSKKDPRRYQMFTRGHVFEAMDIAFSEALSDESKNNFAYIEKVMYSKYLNYDNIPATQGGDNALTMTSIKANAADLMDYSTLIKDLKKIQSLLEMKDKSLIKQRIQELFISKEKYQTLEDFNAAADNAVDKLINLLQI